MLSLRENRRKKTGTLGGDGKSVRASYKGGGGDLRQNPFLTEPRSGETPCKTSKGADVKKFLESRTL